MNEKPAPKAVALLPVAVFLVLYLVLGIVLEYVLKSRWASIRSPSSLLFGGSAGGLPAKPQCEL